MPLTPEDVQNKEFTTVRLREGYDMQEVDDFLDEVQSALERSQRENDELRDKLSAVTRGGGVAPSVESVASRQGEAPVPPPSAAMPEPVAATGPEPGRGQPSEAAAKVLALAQRTADELVADAKAEADRLLSDAQQRADKIDSELKSKVSKIEAEARQRAESMEQEAAQRRQDVFGALEAECAQLERRRDELRDFEREYRSRLKAYLQAELRKLETGAVEEGGPIPVGQPAGGPQPDGPQPDGPQPDGPQPDGPLPAMEPGDGYVEPNSGSQQSAAESGAAQAAAQASNSNTATGTGGSLRSVASLLEDDQR